LVILKYIAGGFKDPQDAVFPLKQKDSVNRRSIRRKIIETAGDEFWVLVAVGSKRWYDLADSRRDNQSLSISLSWSLLVTVK